MTTIVTDAGFVTDTWDHTSPKANSLDLGADSDPSMLTDRLAELEMMRIDVGSFGDGRGFTLARRLRMMGFEGRLRAAGHIVADQYAMARRAGFDEVEISAELARRQPEEHWRFRSDWRANDYQSRLRG